jgi:predicted porin
MKMTSRIALVAAAGFLIGAATPAKAADLGDGCCADLEERVAELEATTARKGNRVVSLQVYGQVNKAIMFFETDIDDDAYIVDNDASGSRFGFTGSASVKPGVTAGYRMEIDVQDEASNAVNEFDDDTAAIDEILIRHNYLWIESETLGRVSLGQQSSATDGIAGINLANALSGPSVDVGTSLTVFDGAALLGQFVSDLDGPREDVIKYDSPSVYGFILSAAWGDDDFYDIALRFSNEWNSIRFAAGIGYQNFEDDNLGAVGFELEIVSGSASVMHVPTGLYVTAAAGQQEIEEFDAGDYWFIQAGIEKRFLSYGATTLYGEYAEYNDFVVASFLVDAESEITRWGLGVVQTFDSAAMDIYAQAQFFDADVDGAEEESEVSTFLVGSRIKF